MPQFPSYDGQWGQISPSLRWCFSKTGLSFPSRTIFLSWAQFPHLPTNPVMISLFRFSFPPSIFLCPQTQFPYLWWSLCPGPSFFSCKLLSALACFSTHDSLFVPSLSFPICDSDYALSFSNPQEKTVVFPAPVSAPAMVFAPDLLPSCVSLSSLVSKTLQPL